MVAVAGPRSLRQLLDAVLTIGLDLDLAAMLLRITQAAVDLVDAKYGALGVLDASGTRLAQFIPVGIDDETQKAIGDLPEGHGLLGQLIVHAKPLRLPDLTEHPNSYGFPPNHPPMHSFLGVPIRVRDQVFGNLYLTDKATAEVFTDVDEELVVSLAAAAGVAIENARLHARLHELAVVEDRERIARDLHDTVIQRLFATGMSLQSAVRLVHTRPEGAVQRIEAAVDGLDVTVKQIRSTIFELARQPDSGSDSLRSQVLGLAQEASEQLGFQPRVLLDGPLDTAVSDRARRHLLATLREALSNVARHAQAQRVDVEVILTGADLVLTVSDDGVGPPDSPSYGSGLGNMESRALELDGTFEFGRGERNGSVMRWTVSATID